LVRKGEPGSCSPFYGPEESFWFLGATPGAKEGNFNMSENENPINLDLLYQNALAKLAARSPKQTAIFVATCVQNLAHYWTNVVEAHKELPRKAANNCFNYFNSETIFEEWKQSVEACKNISILPIAKVKIYEQLLAATYVAQLATMPYEIWSQPKASKHLLWTANNLMDKILSLFNDPEDVRNFNVAPWRFTILILTMLEMADATSEEKEIEE
jgi:hypothetical protein